MADDDAQVIPTENYKPVTRYMPDALHIPSLASIFGGVIDAGAGLVGLSPGLHEKAAALTEGIPLLGGDRYGTMFSIPLPTSLFSREAPASISPGLATDTPQGASVPSFVEGLGGYSSARMTGPTQEKPRDVNWAGAFQAFGAGLADAGMGLQGKQGNALANLMEFQQKQQQRQAELREKIEQQEQEKNRHDAQTALGVIEKLKDNPDQLERAMKAMADNGNIMAQTMNRAGVGREEYDSAKYYVPTVRKFNPVLADQIERDPRSVPTHVLRAVKTQAQKILTEEANDTIDASRAEFLEQQLSLGEVISRPDRAFLDKYKKSSAETEKAIADALTAKLGPEQARTDLGLKAEELLTRRLYSQPQAAATLAQTQAQNILDPRVQEENDRRAMLNRTLEERGARDPWYQRYRNDLHDIESALGLRVSLLDAAGNFNPQALAGGGVDLKALKQSVDRYIGNTNIPEQARNLMRQFKHTVLSEEKSAKQVVDKDVTDLSHQFPPAQWQGKRKKNPTTQQEYESDGSRWRPVNPTP